MYGEATLKPDGDQKAAVDSLVAKFPGEGGAGDRIRTLMEKVFAESDSGLSYKKDVEPWLGDEAAFFLSRVSADGNDGEGALLLATEDEDKARATIEKAIDDGKAATYKDTDYIVEGAGAAGVVDGWVVIGSEDGFKAAVDVADDGRSMEDDEAYQDTLDDAPDERLGFIYFNSPAFMKELAKMPAGAQLGQLSSFFKEPLLATGNADESGIRFEAIVPKSLAAGLPVVAEGSDLAADLPGDSWLAMAQPELGKTLNQYIELVGGTIGGSDVLEQQFKATTGLDLQEDVVSWMGDWGVFVRGESVAELSGALIVETSDEQASGRVIDTIARFARESAEAGDRVRPYELGRRRRGCDALDTRRAAADPPLPGSTARSCSPTATTPPGMPFRPARSSVTPPSSRRPRTPWAATTASPSISRSRRYWPWPTQPEPLRMRSGQEVKPYLEPLGALVGGAREEGDKLHSAFGVTVR